MITVLFLLDPAFWSPAQAACQPSGQKQNAHREGASRSTFHLDALQAIQVSPVTGAVVKLGQDLPPARQAPPVQIAHYQVLASSRNELCQPLEIVAVE